ncbi:hypothetical protein BBB_1035 [Bifidobacterium bifidum BGN4]|uniref:Uncharacterized protein n=2 Tax=Bifidobacterium bifidum TaxID=1681 RepID=I3WIB4_BIFBI|nr:hypothetical protein BBB_1035 [Bifidobacterium bifidum BGN4]KWZ80423.1 hypothetical protein HMPREF3196_01753 [Bifidobacterium bifidum]
MRAAHSHIAGEPGKARRCATRPNCVAELQARIPENGLVPSFPQNM